jgi:hypothetical protein
MFKKTLITLGLLGTAMLSGCVVYAPPHYGAVVYGPGPAVVVAPVIPVFGFYGGGYGRGYYGYHRGWR